MELIKKYFPNLDSDAMMKFESLMPLYKEWNDKINVISRKDIENLYLHHVLHSLSLAKYMNFVPGANILDLGTGGGFPGIPLAIFYPETEFHLIDSIGKKITVVKEVADALNLKNVSATHGRAEEIKGAKYDFVVTRAVATADKLLNWSRKLISKKHQHAIPNGIIALKGGNLKEELKLLQKGEYTEVNAISDYFEEDFFTEKFILYIQG